MNKIFISTVTPVYTGEKFLPELIGKIEQLRDKWRDSESVLELTEAIFINDASADKSLDLLHEIQKDKPWIKIINLSRNFGQHQATIAGILHSSGDWVITLDEDLQHDPIYIDAMLEHAVESEVDIVYARPEVDVHESFLRDWSSRSFKTFVSYITDNQHVRKFCSYRLIRGSIARAASSVCSHGTYFDIALCWFSNRISSIRLPLKDVRYLDSGESGYTVKKLFSHARRLIISSETKSLRIGAGIGFISIFFSLIFGTIIFIDKLINPLSVPVEGWTSLFLTLLFFSGLITIMLGLVLEYISVIILHIQGKPTFFVVDRLTDKTLLSYYTEIKHDHLSVKPKNK